MNTLVRFTCFTASLILVIVYNRISNIIPATDGQSLLFVLRDTLFSMATLFSMGGLLWSKNDKVLIKIGAIFVFVTINVVLRTMYTATGDSFYFLSGLFFLALAGSVVVELCLDAYYVLSRPKVLPGSDADSV
jgi:hypothetical protein